MPGISNVMIKFVKLLWWPSVGVFSALILSAIIAIIVTPKFNTMVKLPLLENVVPLQLGEWENKPSSSVQVSVNSISDAVYDQVLMRTYENRSGKQVMLAIAFAAQQRQEVKIHQPEVCYPAQGYKLLAIRPHDFTVESSLSSVKGKQLLFKNNARLEAVSYWVRIGDAYPVSGWEMRVKIFKDGLKGKVADGVLVRVSTVINDESEASAIYDMHEKFLAELVRDVEESNPDLLVSANIR